MIHLYSFEGGDYNYLRDYSIAFEEYGGVVYGTAAYADGHDISALVLGA